MKNERMNRVTMNVSHVNPDAHVDFTVVGIGKDRKEASIFALGAFVNFMDGIEDDEIIDYNEALEIVNERFSEEEIKSFINKELENNSDSFFNSYELTNVDYNWEEVEIENTRGLIQDVKVTETEY